MFRSERIDSKKAAACSSDREILLVKIETNRFCLDVGVQGIRGL